MTPTTAAVIALRGAVNPSLPFVDSMIGPPARIKMNDGRKVKNVTIHAARAPPKKRASGPSQP